MTQQTQQTHGNVLCTILSGPPGCGKTTKMLGDITQQPGRYFLVAPRVELIEEHYAWLQRLAGPTSPMTLVPIHSDQNVKGAIERRIGDALRAHAEDENVVVVATHDALLNVDPDDLAGWHVRIDELPSNIVSGSARVGASWTALGTYYALGSAWGKWRDVSVLPNVDLPSLMQIRQDVSRDLGSFHRLARSRQTVSVDVQAWRDLSIANRVMSWWSAWTPAILRDCASITITAAGFEDSLFKAAVDWRGGVTFDVQVIGTRRSPTDQPAISISYYTQHRGSTTWWETDDGSLCLVAISRHLEGAGFDGYWSCNRAIVPYFRHRFGQHCEPKQAGSNALRHQTSCAMMYSSKAQDSDRTILDLLGLDVDAILRAREYEDLWQFALRGAIRDLSYEGAYDIHVYSRDQADELERRFRQAGYVDVATIPVDDAEVMDVERPTRREEEEWDRNDDPTTGADERDRRRRERERRRGQLRRDTKRNRRVAEGTLRPRGRPRQSIQLDV